MVVFSFCFTIDHDALSDMRRCAPISAGYISPSSFILDQKVSIPPASPGDYRHGFLGITCFRKTEPFVTMPCYQQMFWFFSPFLLLWYLIAHQLSHVIYCALEVSPVWPNTQIPPTVPDQLSTYIEKNPPIELCLYTLNSKLEISLESWKSYSGLLQSLSLSFTQLLSRLFLEWPPQLLS